MPKKKNGTINKVIKKADKRALFCILLSLILGICCGVIAMFVAIQNDTFELIGQSEIVLEVGDTYTEQKAKAIAFGKDISSDIKIIGNVDTSKEGEYVIKYRVDNFRFKGYTLYRKIIVGGNE